MNRHRRGEAERCRAEKHGEPRVFKVSAKLIAMLKSLPKNSELVFGNTLLVGHRCNFIRQRRRLARKLQNPRLNQITFHTLRPLEGNHGIQPHEGHPIC